MGKTNHQKQSPNSGIVVGSIGTNILIEGWEGESRIRISFLAEEAKKLANIILRHIKFVEQDSVSKMMDSSD